jgi:diguanylate cyclase (GGDEF)-like protein
MKRLFQVFGSLLWSASVAWAAAPAELTTLHAIHALSKAEAAKMPPVAFEATVTYVRGYEQTLFVQDGVEGLFVLVAANTKLNAGDRVLVRGTALGGYRTIVISSSIALHRHGDRPKPVPSNYDQLIHAQHDSELVTIRGTIRAVNLVVSSNVRSTNLEVLTDGGYIDVVVENDDASAFKGLLDAEVEICGVDTPTFDNKLQPTGIELHVASMADVKILNLSKTNPSSLPAIPMDTIYAGHRVHDLTNRIRVHGTVTYSEPGSAVVLQEGTKSLWIQTRTRSDLRIGDIADATGFPDTHDGFLVLAHAAIQDSHVYAPITPLPGTWKSITVGDTAYNGHVYDLVSIEGVVVTEAREAFQDEYILVTEGHQFSVNYRHSDRASMIPLPTMKMVPLGSKVRVTGICMPEDSNPFNGPVPFDILLRSYDDIVVVAKPSLMNIRNMFFAISLLILVVVGVGAWGWMLRAKVHQQTATLAAMAQFEQRRSLILEKINGSDPLAEILKEITSLVSSLLNGANCWCVMAGGATFGIAPSQLNALRVVEMKIASHKDSTLETLSVAFDPRFPRSAEETAALTVGARLASLAIDTRRLYTDLRRRSEFDLLTDIPNRFAMEKLIDARIEEAQQTAGMLGLIYIDLDNFKQVNDRYGHHVGDLFLQEAASRMKLQLRGGDMLARLGGDEFTALVSIVHSRRDVEEIACRLEHCFDDPFIIEEVFLSGAASVGIAFYPENGATRDSLLSAADAAMYEVKNTKRKIAEILTDTSNSEAALKTARE